MAQPQQDQNDCHGVNCVQHRDGDTEDHAQAQIAHQEGEKCNDIGPGAVGNLLEKHGKILRNGVDQAHTGGQTGQGEDGSQQHGTDAAEHLVDDAAQRPGTVFLNFIDPGAAHSHIGQHGIHQGQDGTGQQACQNCIAHFVPLLLQAKGPQGRGDHQAEIQCGNGIHGVIALGKALEQRRVGVALLRRRNLGFAPEQEADKQQRQQHQQHRRKAPTDAVYQLAGVQAQPERHQEKHQGIRRHPQRRIAVLRQIGGHSHLKGHGGRSGNAQSRTDGQIDQHRENQREPLAPLTAQLFQPIESGHDHHAQHRQYHRRHQKANHGREGIGSRILPQKGRKNQIPRPKEQRKKHDAYHQKILFSQFHNIFLSFPENSKQIGTQSGVKMPVHSQFPKIKKTRLKFL